MSRLTSDQRLERMMSLRPLATPSRAETRAERQRFREEKPGFIEAVGLAAESEWIGGWLMRTLDRGGFEPDPGFNPYDPENLEVIGRGVPTDLLDAFEGAVSLDHAMKIREQTLEVAEKRRKLASLGWRGAALRIGASILDPAAIGADLVTGGVAAPWIYAGKASRLARAARLGVVAGMTEASLEAIALQADAERDEYDVLFAGLAGFGLAGGLSFGIDTAVQRAARRSQRLLEIEELTDEVAGGRLAMGAASPAEVGRARTRAEIKTQLLESIQRGEGSDVYKDVASGADDIVVRDELLRAAGFDAIDDAELVAELKKMNPGEAVDRLTTLSRRYEDVHDPELGIPDETRPVRREEPARSDGDNEAAEDAPPPKVAGDLFLGDVSDGESGMSWMRFSMIGRLGRDRIPPEVRAVARMIASDPIAPVGGVATDAADAAAHRWFRGHAASYYRQTLPMYAQWRQNKGLRHSDRVRKEFYEEVGRAIRAGGKSADPVVAQAARVQTQLQDSVRRLATRHGMSIGVIAEGSGSYLPRVYDAEIINRAIDAYGDGPVVEAFARAINAGRPAEHQLSDELANRIARGVLKKIRRLDEGDDMIVARMFSGEEAEELAKVLRDNVEGISESEIQSVLYATLDTTQPQTGFPRGQHRLALDENATAAMPDGSVLTISDLLVNDAERLFTMYARQVTGAAAMNEVVRSAAARYGQRFSSVEGLIDYTRRQMLAAGLDADTVDDAVRSIRVLSNAVMGRRLHEGGETSARIHRMLRGINFLSRSGQFVTAQVGEIGNILGSFGVRATIEQIPAMRRTFARARDGTLSNELLREMEVMVGTATDHVTNQVASRWSDIGDFAPRLSRAEEAINKGTRLASTVSGMAAVTSFTQRAAASIAAQKWAMIAHGGRRPSAARLRQLGLSEEMVDRITAQMRKHSKFEDGMFGRRIMAVRANEWDDTLAAAKFVTAMQRWSTQAIQENSIGSLSRWMTTDMGRTLIQFRSFGIQAWEKQTLARLQSRDFSAFMGAALSSLTAATAYVVQQSILAQGRDDKDEYLRARLSMGEIAKVGFQRGGWSSLIPGGFDTIYAATGGDPVFTQRTSGLGADFLSGIPTVGLANDLSRTTRAIGRAVRGEDEFTQSDARRASRLLPLQNVFGIRNALDALVDRFPEDE